MFFSYKAIDPEGRMVNGTMEAEEARQVIASLRAQHMTPVTVSKGAATDINNLKLGSGKPKAKDLSMFCEQFCSLLRAGVTIIDALKMLQEQTKQATLKDGIRETIAGISGGRALGDAMSDSPKAFDDTFVNLVRAGEASGSLDVSLERMGTQYKKDAEINAAIKKALVYPIIVLIVSVIVVIFMLVKVVPSFMDMFNDLEIDMPKLTLAVVAASEWMQTHITVMLLILIAIVVSIVLFKRSETGKKFFSWISLHMPGVGNFVIKSNASKIARTLSTLLSAGMTLPQALEILQKTVSNYYIKNAIKEVLDDVMVGRPMSEKFSEYPNLFPPMLIHMIHVGEDTGDMSSMLTRTADYFDLEVETATQTMMTAMQPMIILVLAGVVGVLIAAVMGPMISLYTNLGDSL